MYNPIFTTKILYKSFLFFESLELVMKIIVFHDISIHVSKGYRLICPYIDILDNYYIS